jgi:hypothetical protein
MIIKVTLLGLIIVLIAVIALSYYTNKECFEDITNQLNASCTDSCESGIQSKDGSAILIMVKKLNPNTNPDPYSKEERDMITGSLLLKVKTDQGLSTVWRAVPCDKGANPPYTANVTDNGRLVIKNNADKEVWATSKAAIKKGSKPYQLVLINKNSTKNGPTDQLRLIDQHGTPVWSASSPDSPDSFKPCDSDPSSGGNTMNECKVGSCPSLLESALGNFKVMLQHDGILKLQSMIPDIPDRILAKAKDKGLNGPYTLFLTKYGNLLILDKTNNQKKPVWSSNSYRADKDQAGKYRLVLAEDGSLTVRAGNGSGEVIWSADSAVPEPMPEPKRKPRRHPSDDPDDPSAGSMPDRTDIDPDNTVSRTGSMAMALKYKSDLLKDLQKVVRNELIANRMTQRLEREDGDDEECGDEDSDAMAQGREYGCDRREKYRCPKNPDGSCPPVPDMSEYIKKDSIPCFGCSLDY